MVDTKRWINPQEFEDRFEIKKSTQKVMRSAGKLPYVKFGGFVKYDLSDIDKLFEKHKMNTGLLDIDGDLS